MPLLRKALSAVNVETLEDWGTCMATAVVSFCYYGPNDRSHTDSKMLIINAFVGDVSKRKPLLKAGSPWHLSVFISHKLGQLTNCLVSSTFFNRGANYQHCIDCVPHAYACALVKTSFTKHLTASVYVVSLSFQNHP